MKQQQMRRWCVVIYDLHSQRKEVSMKSEKGEEEA